MCAPSMQFFIISLHYSFDASWFFPGIRHLAESLKFLHPRCFQARMQQ